MAVMAIKKGAMKPIVAVPKRENKYFIGGSIWKKSLE